LELKRHTADRLFIYFRGGIYQRPCKERKLIRMTVRFPNASRVYSPARDAIHFWGYDQSMETSFFISTAALQKLAPGTGRLEEALLAAFDSNRARIFAAAIRLYGNGRLRICYYLTPSDF